MVFGVILYGLGIHQVPNHNMPDVMVFGIIRYTKY